MDAEHSPERRVGTSAAKTRRIALESVMNGIVYLVGLVVIVLAILSFLGLR